MDRPNKETLKHRDVTLSETIAAAFIFTLFIECDT